MLPKYLKIDAVVVLNLKMHIKKDWIDEVYDRFFANYANVTTADFHQFDNDAKRAHEVIISKLQGQCQKNEESKFEQFLKKLDKKYPKLMKKNFIFYDRNGRNEKKFSCKKFAKRLVILLFHFNIVKSSIVKDKLGDKV